MKIFLLTVTLFFSVFKTSGQCQYTTQSFPFTTEDYSSYKYSWSSSLYLKSQIGNAQTLTKMAFMLNNHSGGSGSYTYSDIRIYVRHTTETTFASSSYPAITGFTKVYEGPVTFTGVGIYSINFSTTFDYNGTNNLEILIENRGGTVHSSRSPWFKRMGSGNVGKVGWRSDASWATSNGQSLQTHNLAISLNGKSLAGGTGCPLPVTLIDFTANKVSSHIALNWQTGSEQNNDYFTVLRSSDLEDWEEIGKVKGNGNSSTKMEYEFTDRKPLGGISYYQLKQTDFNGESVAFDAVSVDLNYMLESAFIYPNPANGDFFISIQHPVSSEATVQIADLSGKIIMTRKILIEKGHNMIPFENSELQGGVYQVIVLYRDGQRKTMKLIKGNQ